MKRFSCYLMALILCVLSIGTITNTKVAAETTLPSVGANTLSLDEAALDAAGYRFVDDRDATIAVTWPYDIEGAFETNTKAYAGTYRWGLGQTGCTITYEFSGTYLAVAFAELADAAKVIVSIDGTKAGEYLPRGTSEESKIVFVKDDLAAGNHTVVLSLEAAPEEENLGNNAKFDCFIVKKKGLEALKVGEKTLSFDEAALNTAGYRFVDDRDATIAVTWPYDIEGAFETNTKAYAGTYRWGLGQTGCTITYEFSGTYLAVAFAELADAAKVIVSIDGTKAGEYLPRGASEESKIVFVKDDLAAGNHTVVLSLEAAPEEENLGNNAKFDCFIVKKKGPEALKVGEKTLSLDEAALDAAGYRFVDDRDAAIAVTWPYDIEGAFETNAKAYAGTYRWGLGQTGCTITYEFSGTYLAVAFAELADAAKVIVSIDGTKAGEYLPRGTSEESKIVFVKDDLAAGNHTVVLSLEAAPEEENLGNNAKFDCFLVQANPTVDNSETGDMMNLFLMGAMAIVAVPVLRNKRKETA